MALIIGITGGIGSGKTTVCRIFELLGVPVFEADLAGKNLLNNNDQLKKNISQIFGEYIYKPKGKINRKRLADIIFNDKNKLKILNELVHPAVKMEFLKWKEDNKYFPYLIHEAAILFESGFYKLMDYTILVTAPENERIKRIMERDGTDENMIRARIRNQHPEEKNKKLATIVLQNDNRRLLIPEIIKIDNNIKKYGKIR